MTLRKLLKRCLHKNQPPHPVENGITFIHHNPKRGNIGDYLCSPRHYFSFQNPMPNLGIVGGGVFKNLGIPSLKNDGYPYEKLVLWGVGQSVRGHEQEINVITDLPYFDWALRDLDRVESDNRFLPCVSCLHPMLDDPPSEKGTLLFLNADQRVTHADGQKQCQRMAAQNNWLLLYNNCGTNEFSEALASCNHVITNSYHGAYWSLLAGRSLALLGYSSKFKSLLATLDLDPGQIIDIQRGSPTDLGTAIEYASCKESSIKLQHPKSVRNQFRSRNIEFARRLQNKGCFNRYELKKHIHA